MIEPLHIGIARANEPRKRHRWKATSDHFYRGPKEWRCIYCGLQKVTEYECVPIEG
jgi:hypothetical protein